MAEEPFKSKSEAKAQAQPTVFAWLLREVGTMEADLREATRANVISADSAKLVLKECIHMLVASQAEEMRKQQKAEQDELEYKAHQERIAAAKAPFERPT